jgi:hypothetical protein
VTVFENEIKGLQCPECDENEMTSNEGLLFCFSCEYHTVVRGSKAEVRVLVNLLDMVENKLDAIAGLATTDPIMEELIQHDLDRLRRVRRNLRRDYDIPPGLLEEIEE